MSRATIGEVRFSYVKVWEPAPAGALDEGKYSASILIPKSNTQALAQIQRAIEEAKAEGMTTKFQGKANGLKLPLRDGDVERPDDPAYAGMYFLNARSTQQPGIVDSHKQPIINHADFYSGCWGYAALSFYSYNSGGSKGVAVGLEHVMKTRDDESFSGGISTDEAFAGVHVDEEVAGYDPLLG